MNDEKPKSGNENSMAGEGTERREALQKMGRFAAYAAPFTVLALTNKAKAASGGGPGKGGSKGSGPGKH
jgi:hypothetical protein